MILIIAEHDNNKTHDSLRSALVAAAALGAGDVEVLVAGHQCRAAAEYAAGVKGVAKVRYADAPQLLLAENFAALVAAMADNYSHIVMCASAKARAVLARAAAMVDSQMISDITEVRDGETFVRPIYAGNALTVVKSGDKTKLLSVRASAFDADESGESNEQSAAAIEEVQAPPDMGLSEIIGEKVSEQTRPELTGARIVVSGGRGIGSAENFKILESLADKLGAALGASRAAVDAGYVSNDFQVGQTGKIVAPDLYIAVGISGAIQHIAGIKDAKCIVAINKDADAPIFDIADYGLVGDLFDEVPALQNALE